MNGLLAIPLAALLAATASPQEPGRALAPGNRAFCAELHRVLASGDAPGNLAFSPLSIRVAMAMLRAGAEGETRAELERAIHLGTDADAVATAWREWFSALTAAAFEHVDSSQLLFHFQRADAAWFQRGLAVKPEYSAHLRDALDAHSEQLDFAGDPEGCRTRINRWVADLTFPAIPELLKPTDISPATSLVLTDALRVTAGWADALAIVPEPAVFHTVDGDTAATFVGGRRMLPWFRDDEWTAVAVPLRSGRLCMAFLLPAASTGLAAVEPSLDGLRLGAIVDALRGGRGARANVDLAVPKFTVRSSFRLNDALQQLGVRRVFGPGAELSGIADADLFVSLVVHETFVELDEHGIEAAAATAVVMKRGAGPVAGEPVRFHADRPFLFAMFDAPTGNVLFFGRVVRP